MTDITDLVKNEREFANALGYFDGAGPEIRLHLHSLCDALTAQATTIADQAGELLSLKVSLVEIRRALYAANGGAITDTIWMPGRPETLFDFIDAALQASETGGKAVTP